MLFRSIASDQFRDAKLSTHFIDEFFSGWEIGRSEIDAAIVAAVITAGDPQTETAALRNSNERHSPWDALNNFELWGSRR